MSTNQKQIKLPPSTIIADNKSDDESLFDAAKQQMYYMIPGCTMFILYIYISLFINKTEIACIIISLNYY